MSEFNVILHGDCLEVLRDLPDNYVDSVVTDPPYGLSKEPDIREVLEKWLAGEDYTHRGGGFMGKTWDSFVPGPSVWREVYRVLKPGGHALVFAGTRTQDLMTVALRMAGFEVRDVIEWLYFSGFPKSLNIHRIIEGRYQCKLKQEIVNTAEKSSSQSGEVKEMVGLNTVPEIVLDVVREMGITFRVRIAEKNFTLLEHIRNAKGEGIKELFVVENVNPNGNPNLRASLILIGRAEDSRDQTDISRLMWEMENTDLNTISLLKKSLEEGLRKGKTSITLTELKMIIDPKIYSFFQSVSTLESIVTMNHTALKPAHEPIIVVRKPLIGTVTENVERYGTGALNIDGCRIGRLEGDRTEYAVDGNEGSPTADVFGTRRRVAYTPDEDGRFPANCITTDADAFYSPYFNVSPPELSKKASKRDRNSDWKGDEITLEMRQAGALKGRNDGSLGTVTFNRNVHPTVKPTDLMAWLVRLVTPPGGVVLDPFAGSGSTLVAAKREGFQFIGIEREAEYVEIARARTLAEAANG